MRLPGRVAVVRRRRRFRQTPGTLPATHRPPSRPPILLWSTDVPRSNATAGLSPSPLSMPLLVRRSPPHRGRPRRGAVRRRGRAASRRVIDRGLPIRRGDSAAGGAGAADHPRDRDASCRTGSTRRAAGCRLREPASTGSRSTGAERGVAGRTGRAPRRSAADERATGGPRCGPASGRSPAPAKRPRYAYVYNSAAWDSFDRWSESRRSDRSGASAQYLPETVQAYSVHLRSVWLVAHRRHLRPRVVSDRQRRLAAVLLWPLGELSGLRLDMDWRDAWAWPTHHYGRWGFSAGAWFWIPGRTWGPAWVSWAYAPGYTSWCPLGWDNRPVLQFGRGITVAATTTGTAGRSWPAAISAPAWVNTSFVGAVRIDVRTREAFVVRGRRAADSRGYAVARNVAPIRVAGSRGPPATHTAARRLARPRRAAAMARPGLARAGMVGATAAAAARSLTVRGCPRVGSATGGRGSATADSGARAAGPARDARTLSRRSRSDPRRRARRDRRVPGSPIADGLGWHR